MGKHRKIHQLVNQLVSWRSYWCCVIFRTSVYNPAEADFVVTLCIHLGGYFERKRMLKNIGIITPYQRQRRMLIEQLSKRFDFFCSA